MTVTTTNQHLIDYDDILTFTPILLEIEILVFYQRVLSLLWPFSGAAWPGPKAPNQTWGGLWLTYWISYSILSSKPQMYAQTLKAQLGSCNPTPSPSLLLLSFDLLLLLFCSPLRLQRLENNIVNKNILLSLMESFKLSE